MMTTKLNTGADMPMLGLGTWRLKGEDCVRSVREALQMGYTHIDTADAYDNHAQVAIGIEESGVDREGIFVTTKVWKDNLRYDDVLSSCERALKELGLDYIDLYLIHWPNKEVPMTETFKALAELYRSGKIRNVGVSNFTERHMDQAMEVAEVQISVNQVELHPYFSQAALRSYCLDNGVVVTAYSPLGQGKLLSDPVLKELAEEKGCTTAQVVLAWLIRHGIVAIPKASSKQHIEENLASLDIEMDQVSMGRVDGLNKDDRLVNPKSIAEFD